MVLCCVLFCYILFYFVFYSLLFPIYLPKMEVDLLDADELAIEFSIRQMSGDEAGAIESLAACIVGEMVGDRSRPTTTHGSFRSVTSELADIQRKLAIIGASVGNTVSHPDEGLLRRSCARVIHLQGRLERAKPVAGHHAQVGRLEVDLDACAQRIRSLFASSGPQPVADGAVVDRGVVAVVESRSDSTKPPMAQALPPAAGPGAVGDQSLPAARAAPSQLRSMDPVAGPSGVDSRGASRPIEWAMPCYGPEPRNQESYAFQAMYQALPSRAPAHLPSNGDAVALAPHANPAPILSSHPSALFPQSQIPEPFVPPTFRPARAPEQSLPAGGRPEAFGSQSSASHDPFRSEYHPLVRGPDVQPNPYVAASYAEPPQRPMAPAGLSNGWTMMKWPIRFGGGPRDPPVEEFIFRVETLARGGNVSEAALTFGLHQILTDAAASWYWVYIRTRPHANWPSVKAALIFAFRSSATDAAIRRQIHDRLQRQGERFMEFCLAIQELNIRLKRRMCEGDLLDVLRRNMAPAYQDRLLFHPVGSLHQLQELCQQVEEMWRSQNEVHQSRRAPYKVNEIAALDQCAESTAMSHWPIQPPASPWWPSDSVHESTPPLAPQPIPNHLSYPSPLQSAPPVPQPTHYPPDPPIPAYYGDEQQYWVSAVDEAARRSEYVICWNCDDMGHTYADCAAARRLFCFGCGAKNLIRTQCPKCSVAQLQGNGYRNGRPNVNARGQPFRPSYPRSYPSQQTRPQQPPQPVPTSSQAPQNPSQAAPMLLSRQGQLHPQN